MLSFSSTMNSEPASSLLLPLASHEAPRLLRFSISFRAAPRGFPFASSAACFPLLVSALRRLLRLTLSLKLLLLALAERCLRPLRLLLFPFFL